MNVETRFFGHGFDMAHDFTSRYDILVDVVLMKDATGVAYFKMSFGYSDIFLAILRVRLTSEFC